MAKATDPLIGGPTTLYIARDGEGRVIYVGITLSLPSRMGSHRKSSAWWREAESIELPHFMTRLEARLVEVNLIQRMQPRFNRADVDESSPRTPGELPIELLSQTREMVDLPDVDGDAKRCDGVPGRTCANAVPLTHARCSKCRGRLTRMKALERSGKAR